MVIFMLDSVAMSVSLLAFVHNPTVKRIFYSTIADASCWKLCAAIYHPIHFCSGGVGYVLIALCQGLRL